MTQGGAAFGGDEIIPAVLFQQVRALGDANGAAFPDLYGIPGQPLVGGIIFLQDDPVKTAGGECFAHLHLNDVLPAIVVVKQTGIKPDGVQINRFAPGTRNRLRRHQIIRCVNHHPGGMVTDIRVHQPEFAVGMGQARRPNAAGIGAAFHVELGNPVQRPAQQPPVSQIPRMVNLHPREPFKCGGGNVIVVSNPADGGVGIEAGEHRVFD